MGLGYACGRRLPRPRWAHSAWAVLVLAAACSDTSGPAEELTDSATSAHFVYHWSPGDDVPDSAYQERHFAWVSEGLGVTPAAPLEYFKYRDAAQLERLTGHDQGTGFAEVGTYRFHTIYHVDNHEWVHALVSAEVGAPPALFNEGIAVAHHGASIAGAFEGDPLWNGTSARDQVRALRAAGTLPELPSLIENDDFWRLDLQITYPVAGMFVRYLLDEAGAEPLLTFIASCPRDATAVTIRARFREVYDGVELDTWWERWLADL